MTRFRMLRPVAATAGVIGLIVGPASAAIGQEDVFVTNRESVQAFLASDGSLDAARVYDQVNAYGAGTVRIENPVSTEGLRNLDGFGGYDVTDDRAVLEFDVDGESSFRTVSDFTGELPVTIEPEYRLDGELVSPRDVVGESGTLDVRFTVRNVTAAPTDVTYFDSSGNEVMVTMDVPIPLVGIFETVLPPSFSSVESSDFNVAGDGRGGTVMRANLVLFDGLPTGGSTAELFYTAKITDGAVPEVQLDVAPVQPTTHANFAGAFQASAQGMQSGRTLATGGSRLDDGLGQLHDGAADLLSGLQLIAEGTEQLRAGLADEAAPGSRELATGANQAANGAGELSAGLNNRLAPGARQLADGAGEAASGAGQLANGLADRLAPGARQLAEGASRLEAGLALLSANLPNAQEGAGLLRAGVEGQILPGIRQVLAGLGGLSSGLDDFETQALAGVDASASSVIGGIGQLEGQVIGGLQQLAACVAGDPAVCDSDDPPQSNIQDAVRQIIAALGMDRVPPDGPVDPDSVEQVGLGLWLIHAGLASSLAEGGSLQALVENLQSVQASLTALSAEDWCVDACPAQLGQLAGLMSLIITGITDENPVTGEPGLIPALEGARDGLDRALTGLGAVDQGLRAIDGGLSDLTQGLEGFQQLVLAGANAFRNEVNAGASASRERFSAGFDQVRQQAVEPLTAGVGALEGGVAGELLGGLTSLEAGLESAVNGADELHDGSRRIADGNADLAAGARDAADGAEKLAVGLRQQLAPGARQLADGAGEAATGARQLADGNRQIADGADRLADGLGDAADGASQLADGTSDAAEGTPALVDGIGEVRDGVGLLKAGGESTVDTYAPNVAVLQAATARGASEALPYGAPEGAVGTAAYSITLAGEAGEGGQNLVKALAAIVILGLAAGGVALARRRATG